VPPIRQHPEVHRIGRLTWLRAAVLGANDGIVSTASLLLGVAAAAATTSEVLTAGVAGLVAGAMSMAAGEYVSVSSQSDSQQAELARERAELASDPDLEHEELARIYMGRGVEAGLAREVAAQLMAKDALGSHALEELGISDLAAARPLQAAFASASTFTAGASIPLLVAVLAPEQFLSAGVATASLVSLAALGAIAAHIGGAPVAVATLRVAFWGALAMALTAGIGALVGAAL